MGQPIRDDVLETGTCSYVVDDGRDLALALETVDEGCCTIA